MSIAGFFNRTVDTQRLANVGGASKRQEWGNIENDLPCAIHPLNPDEVLVQGSAFYGLFKMFCAKDADVEIGDKIVDGSDTYVVQGKSLYDDLGGRSNEHMRLNIAKGK